jgi:hypothetical protein
LASLKGRDKLEARSIHGRITFKYIWKKKNVYAGFKWLRIGINGGAL